MESSNASLFEDIFLCKSKKESSSSKRVFETINGNNQNENNNSKVKLRHNKRTRTEKSFGLDFICFKGNLRLSKRQ